MLCFIVAILCYVIGAIFAYNNWWVDWDAYQKIVAIVGGLASVVGILGLRSDTFQDLNSNMLRELAQKKEEYEKKQEKLQSATDQIAKLELKKEDLEALVEKASLSLYYKAELKRMYDRLGNLVEKNDDISKLIDEIKKMESDAKDLDCKIDKDDNVKEIIEAIQKANERTERKLRFTDIVLSFFGNQITVRI